MGLMERSVYPHFPASFIAKELHQLYSPSEDEILFAKRTVRGDSSLLNFLAMLKAFQHLHYFPVPTRMPLAIVRHIHSCLHLTSIPPTAYPAASLYRHQKTIRDYLAIKAYTPKARHLMVRAVLEAARSRDDLVDLLNVAVQTLFYHQIELPAFATIERLVRRARHWLNQSLFNRVLDTIDEQRQTELEKLLVADALHRVSSFNRLKEPPQNATLTHLREWQKHLGWLESLGPVEQWLNQAQLPAVKQAQFALQAKASNIGDLKDCLPAKRYTLLLCLIAQARVNCRDNLVEMFLRRMSAIHKSAKEELELLREGQRDLSENLIEALGEMVELVEEGQPLKIISEEELAGQTEAEDHALEPEIEEPLAWQLAVESEAQKAGIDPALLKDAELGRRFRVLVTSHGGPEALLAACQSVSAYHGNNYLPLLPRFYKTYRAVLFRVLSLLKLGSATANVALEKALKTMVAHQKGRAKWLPDELDLSFANEQWQKQVRKRKAGTRQYRLDRRMLEICVFSYLAFELRTGDMYVEGSADYADYRTQLLSWEECEPLVTNYCQQMDLPSNAQGLVRHLRQTLEQTARRVDGAFPENEHLTINAQGLPALKRTKATPGPAYLAAVKAALHQKLPKLSLLQILVNTQHWCNWLRHFGPLSGADPKLEQALEKYILTVFAYGARLGPVQTAAHLNGLATEQQLSFINRSHISIAKLEAANTELINAYSRFTLPTIWGNPKIAAADGTKIELPEGSLFSQYHVRYGHMGGIAYHHVSDTYVALFTHFIACGIWEAVYIIDGLLKNKSLIQPDTLHADTQGQTTVVFGLAYLLGIKLMPRIRNWRELVFYRPFKEARYSHLDKLFRETVDWSLIETHWQDLMRVVLSIKAGKILPSTLLRKLGNYSRKNRLYQAFAELGHVIRTIYLLEFLESAGLRQQVTGSTNKVEKYNQFTDWITFGGEALLMVYDAEERDKRVKYTDLIANAIMLQNVVELSRALNCLKAEGLVFSKEEVAHLSPYLTRHIRRFGDYILDLEKVPEPLSEEVLRLEV